jgi:hypothetical protein
MIKHYKEKKITQSTPLQRKQNNLKNSSNDKKLQREENNIRKLL